MEGLSIWGKVPLKKNSTLELVIDDMTLSLRDEGDICSFTLASESKGDDELIANRVVGKMQEMYLLPALPDRTLVLKPKANLSILPATRYKFFVYLPVTFQMYAGMVKPSTMVFEHALADLSSTWFGEPHDGELSYALYSSFDTEISPSKRGDNYVICPVEIYNNSKEVLDIKRLAVRCVHLDIYSDGELLISNKVKINYLGLDTLSNVEFSKTVTTTIPNLKQIASARAPEDKTILRRSFQLIRHITQF